MRLTSCSVVRMHALCSHFFTIETNGESNILVCVRGGRKGLRQEGLMTLCVPGSLAQTITHVMRLGERAHKGKACLAFIGAATNVTGCAEVVELPPMARGNETRLGIFGLPRKIAAVVR